MTKRELAAEDSGHALTIEPNLKIHLLIQKFLHRKMAILA